MNRFERIILDKTCEGTSLAYKGVYEMFMHEAPLKRIAKSLEVIWREHFEEALKYRSLEEALVLEALDLVDWMAIVKVMSDRYDRGEL